MTQQDEPAAVADLLQDVRSVLARIEQHLAARLPREPEQPDDDDADDLVPDNLIETWRAAQRFGRPQDTVRRWCREGCGVRRGGRWFASIPRIRRRIAGELI